LKRDISIVETVAMDYRQAPKSFMILSVEQIN